MGYKVRVMSIKTFKIVQIVGFIVIISGVLLRVSGEIYGTGVGVFGVLIYAIGRVGAWLKSDSA